MLRTRPLLTGAGVNCIEVGHWSSNVAVNHTVQARPNLGAFRQPSLLLAIRGAPEAAPRAQSSELWAEALRSPLPGGNRRLESRSSTRLP